ncbi:MAG TPA: hypothetical protein VFQ06_15845 [Nitrospira sp.]|nr:hypothetical protein [Nitrospira sp.]
MSPTIRNQAKLAGIALAAGLAFTAFGAGDAQAQNVFTFECGTGPFDVRVDIRGLGNENLCVVGTTTVNADCACVGGGGNCPADANKQTVSVTTTAAQEVEAKNGRVNTTVELNVAEPSNATCAAALMCPSGQTARLIQFDTEPLGTEFEVCTTAADDEGPCDCVDQEILAEAACDPTSQIVFGGRRDNCLALFE